MTDRVVANAKRVVDSLLGAQIGVYNTVAARDCTLISQHQPDHKEHLVAAVRSLVTPGDRVVVVGGGRCVAAVHAARCGGDVHVFEAGRDGLTTARSAKQLNDVDFCLSHAVVGHATAVDGPCADTRIAPAQLSGDVLVLDCEGAEKDILPVDGFDTVIVETHPERGSPLSAISDALGTHEVVGEDPVDGQVVVS